MSEKFRLLIVDDSPSIQTMVREALAGSPFEIVGAANNGQEGVDYYESLKPDIVLMDIVMPQMTGVEALKVIVEKDPQARVVMLTSMRGREDVLTCKKYGAKNYVLKPFDGQKLIEILLRVCKNETEV